MRGAPMSVDYLEKEINLAVEGMNCEHCANTIEREVSRIDGVSRVLVSLRNKDAQVVFDPQKTSVEDICKVISQPGFSAREKA